jgi:hypothetical protein
VPTSGQSTFEDDARVETWGLAPAWMLELVLLWV